MSYWRHERHRETASILPNGFVKMNGRTRNWSKATGIELQRIEVCREQWSPRFGKLHLHLLLFIFQCTCYFIYTIIHLSMHLVSDMAESKSFRIFYILMLIIDKSELGNVSFTLYIEKLNSLWRLSLDINLMQSLFDSFAKAKGILSVTFYEMTFSE